ncbi:uncharacterized protein C11orf98 homolog isoform X1 [Corapipo altera]|uniref:uncharacterized protein C11orf98 homolog isoform X1 n=1 Tax=Corapipo altera TaxID=415028 RepID=UPI000FD69D28|nr:uncharacterized protein C11orf98 homolog isoform X1 [Corapipo altera]
MDARRGGVIDPEVKTNRKRVPKTTWERYGDWGENQPAPDGERRELRKKLFKRRRELARGRRQKRRSGPAVSVPPPLWGKRRRKELKRLRGAAKRALEAAAAAGRKPEMETRKGKSSDVEMEEEEPLGTAGTPPETPLETPPGTSPGTGGT